MNYEAVIFDCDGVLVDSEKYSCGAWTVLFKEDYNIDVGDEYDCILGKTTLDTTMYYFDLLKLEYDDELLKKIAKKKENVYYRISENNLMPINGIEEFIQKVNKEKLKIAVASSGTLKKITYSLTQIKLFDKFQTIISADDIVRAKPEPDIFIAAMKKLNVSPEKAIVIEDSIMGVQAAKKSGAFTIAITSTYPREKLTEADLIVDSYSEINLSEL